MSTLLVSGGSSDAGPIEPRRRDCRVRAGKGRQLGAGDGGCGSGEGAGLSGRACCDVLTPGTSTRIIIRNKVSSTASAFSITG